MKILGIDPGLETIGFGCIQVENKKNNVLDFGIIKTSSKDDFFKRLYTIQEDVKQILLEFQPEYLGIEKLFFGTNVNTALPVAHARGIICLQAYEHGSQIHEFSPNQIKSMICGNGKAEKIQIQKMLRHHTNLTSIPRPDDAADAIAIAVCTAMHLGL